MSYRASSSSLAASALATGAATEGLPSGYVSVDGFELYYEIHGAGVPLILLHGGLLTIEMIAPLITALAASRQVIAVELEGHGHTALMDRPLRFEQMADDVAALIEQLGTGPADVFGFSLGGGVAWQVAIRHPELVRKLIVASAPSKTAGWAPEVLGAISTLSAEAAMATTEAPFYQSYIKVAPRSEDWPKLVERVGQLISSAESAYDWSGDIKGISSPILLIVGDADSVLPEQTLELFRLLGGGVIGDFVPLPNAQLAILPGMVHSSLLTRSDLLLPVIESFLDPPMVQAA